MAHRTVHCPYVGARSFSALLARRSCLRHWGQKRQTTISRATHVLQKMKHNSKPDTRCWVGVGSSTGEHPHKVRSVLSSGARRRANEVYLEPYKECHALDVTRSALPSWSLSICEAEAQKYNGGNGQDRCRMERRNGRNKTTNTQNRLPDLLRILQDYLCMTRSG